MIYALTILLFLIQTANVCLTFWLIKVTGQRLAWMFLGTAMLIELAHQVFNLYEHWVDPAVAPTLLHQLLNVAVLALVTIGLFLIKPHFDAIRAAELASQQSEAQHRSLFESSPLAIMICREQRIEYANRAALKIFGAASLGDLLHHPLTDFVHSRYRAEVVEQLRSLTEENPSKPITEIQALRTDRTTVDIEILIALFVFGGNLAQYVVLWDVSDRRRREETLRERETELAHVMRLHTMGEIAAEMAHEINQPLYAISNFAQAGILHLQSGDPERMAQLQTCLEHAHAQAQRAAQIVKNLRNFVSKSEGEFVDVSFHKLVRDAVELVAIEARRQKAAVELALAKEDAIVHVNAVQIQQVLVNLLVNAFDAMQTLPEFQRRVRIVTCVDAHSVELAVEDNGTGIPADKLNRVFEPFFTTKSQGMGMGLAVSRTIVVNHGGKIWAERNEPAGTKFRVTLPREE